jgi:hypothetical protein
MVNGNVKAGKPIGKGNAVAFKVSGVTLECFKVS